MRDDTLARIAAYADRILFDEHRIVSANEIKGAIGGGTDQVRAAHAAWMAGLAERLRPVNPLPALPATLSEILVEAWSRAVENARDEAHAALAAQEQQAADQVAAANGRVAALETAIELSEREKNEAQRHLTEQAQALERQRDDLASARAQRQALEDRLHALQARSENDAQRYQAELSALREQLGTAYQRSDALELRLIAQIDEQKTAIQQLEKQLGEKDTEARALQVQNAVLTEKVATVHAKNEQLEHDLRIAQKTLGQLRTDLAVVKAAALTPATETPHGDNNPNKET